MFILDGRPLAPGSAFTHDGIQYPANWLYLSTPEEKEAIGIQEQPDPPTWDQRFAWGYREDGTLIWKNHDELVKQWVQQTRTTAGTLLTSSDWLVIREQDNGIPVPPEWRTWRETVRLASGSKVYEIEQTVDTPALAAYVTGQEYSSWPADPNTPPPQPEAPAAAEDVVAPTADEAPVEAADPAAGEAAAEAAA